MHSQTSGSAHSKVQMEQDLVHKIQELFLDELSIRVASVDLDLVQKGILDSVTMVRLAAALEKRFQVRVPIEDLVLEAPCSVASIARLTAECRRADDARQPLVGEVRALLAEKLSIKVQSAETDLFETGALDSMMLVQLVLALEEHFGIALPVQEIELTSFATATKIAETVAARKRNGAGNAAGGL